ncbi:MAG: threonylcarbamoyl-AMP synthase [Alphaproteobacteria bacterium]|nr:threonylcarbamoyl-AMP synthase [Alphaproteobacteria bacterium]
MNNIYPANSANITLASEVIRKGGLVSFPTETVYGLGADVYNTQAVASIFEAKNRPHFDPLISHIADIDFLPTYAQTDDRVLALAKHFCPGPLTFILNRTDNNPAIDLACSGLNKIAVRLPDNPIALDLIRQSGVPIVAPSANKFKSVSPTTAQHVRESLGDKVNMILDGGPCRVGVESTIIDVTQKQIVLLRAGGTAVEEIESFLGEKILISDGDPNKPSAPGQLLKHYAPKKSLRINAVHKKENEFLIGFGDVKDADLNLSPSGDLKEAASNLFAYMRLADEQANDKTLAMSPIPTTGLGLAINDRIKRASYK